MLRTEDDSEAQTESSLSLRSRPPCRREIEVDIESQNESSKTREDRPFGLGGTSGYSPPDGGQRMTFSQLRLLSRHGADRLTWFSVKKPGVFDQQIPSFHYYR